MNVPHYLKTADAVQHNTHHICVLNHDTSSISVSYLRMIQAADHNVKSSLYKMYVSYIRGLEL